MSRANSRRKNKFEVVSNDIEEHNAFSSKKFSPHHLVSFKPNTTPQEDFLRAYYNDVPVIVQVGSAGTGKTITSVYAALTDVLSKETPYDKLIIIRSAVQAREIGFTPGTVEEKDAEYEALYDDMFNDVLTFKSRNYANLKAKHMVEFHNTSFLRGKTFNDSIIIVDEFQSMSYHELATCITRVGYNSRIIFCGDMKQNDLHKKGDVSGFHEFMKVIDKMPSNMVEVVTYLPEHNVRSGISKEFLLAEERV